MPNPERENLQVSTDGQTSSIMILKPNCFSIHALKRLIVGHAPIGSTFVVYTKTGIREMSPDYIIELGGAERGNFLNDWAKAIRESDMLSIRRFENNMEIPSPNRGKSGMNYNVFERFISRKTLRHPEGDSPNLDYLDTISGKQGNPALD